MNAKLLVVRLSGFLCVLLSVLLIFLSASFSVRADSAMQESSLLQNPLSVENMRFEHIRV